MADPNDKSDGGDQKKDSSWTFGKTEKSQNFGDAPTQPGAGQNPQQNKAWEYKKGEGFKQADVEEDPNKGKPTTKVTIAQKKWGESSGYAGPSTKGDGKSENASGKYSAGLLYGKAGASSELSYDLTKGEGNLTLIKGELKGSVVHGGAEGEFDIEGWIGDQLGVSPGTPAPPGTPGAPGGGPMAARVGDLTGHGSPLAPGIGSVNVLIGGLPAWRANLDFHACPVVKGVVPDVGGMVVMGSPTVFINFMMACRSGDMVVEIPGGPNSIVMGCPTVMIGPSAGGGGGGGGAAAGQENNLTVKGKAEGDLLTGGIDGEIAGVIDPKKGEYKATAKASAFAAVAQGTIEGELAIPIPFTEHAITLGAQGTGAVLAAGAGAEATIGGNKKDGYKITAGAKAGAGLLGAGVKFSIGFK